MCGVTTQNCGQGNSRAKEIEECDSDTAQIRISFAQAQPCVPRFAFVEIAKLTA